MPQENQYESVARLLADLGANHEAFLLATRIARKDDYPGVSFFWDRRLRGALSDPGFPAVAEEFGLFRYWKTTHTKPDVCGEKAPPPFRWAAGLLGGTPGITSSLR